MDTPRIIAMLRSCKIRPIMVTGDNAFTAVSVARQVRPSHFAFSSPLCTPLRRRLTLFDFLFLCSRRDVHSAVSFRPRGPSSWGTW